MNTMPAGDSGSVTCPACGTNVPTHAAADAATGATPHEARCVHGDLVRSVALGDEYVLSGSYDLSIKVNRCLLTRCKETSAHSTTYGRCGIAKAAPWSLI